MMNEDVLHHQWYENQFREPLAIIISEVTTSSLYPPGSVHQTRTIKLDPGTSRASSTVTQLIVPRCIADGTLVFIKRGINAAVYTWMSIHGRLFISWDRPHIVFWGIFLPEQCAVISKRTSGCISAHHRCKYMRRWTMCWTNGRLSTKNCEGKPVMDGKDISFVIEIESSAV